MKRKTGNYKIFEQHAYYVPGVADMFVILAWLLAGALLGNVVTFVSASVLGPDAGMEYGMLLAYPIMFIPAMIYAGMKSGRNSYVRKGFKLDSDNFGGPGKGWICAAVVILATIALSFVADSITAVMPPMPEWLETVLKSMTDGTLWINILSVSIFAPIFEEWLCRGMVLRGLLGNGIKPVWAIVISAAFFAVIHANPWQAIPAMLLGSLFGYVYYKTGSLKLTMLMHCANNTFAIICTHLDAFKDKDNWREVIPGPGYWIIFLCCLMLVCLAVLYFRRIPLKSPRGNIDELPEIFD